MLQCSPPLRTGLERERREMLCLSPDIYVQVTVTPHDRESGHRSDSPQTMIVEVPGARIKRYRDQSPYAGEATDEQLAEYLGAKSLRTRWQGLVSTNPGAGVSIPSHFPNARDRSKRVSPILVRQPAGMAADTPVFRLGILQRRKKSLFGLYHAHMGPICILKTNRIQAVDCITKA
jgi:hypothetical protein